MTGADSTARTRALKLVEDELGQCAAVGATQDDTADWIVDRLIQHPEVLRALAGVATPPGTFSHEDPRAGRDYMAIYRDFWQGLVETDGTLDLDKVARELSDFSFVMDQLPLVYDEITGGRMSKHMYFARDVISEANARREEEIEEAVAEARQEWEDVAGVATPTVSSALARVVETLDAADQAYDYVTADVDTDVIRASIVNGDPNATTAGLRTAVRALLADSTAEEARRG